MRLLGKHRGKFYTKSFPRLNFFPPRFPHFDSQCNIVFLHSAHQQLGQFFSIGKGLAPRLKYSSTRAVVVVEPPTGKRFMSQEFWHCKARHKLCQRILHRRGDVAQEVDCCSTFSSAKLVRSGELCHAVIGLNMDPGPVPKVTRLNETLQNP